MSTFETATIEPRKIFLAWLIHEMSFIEALVYHTPGDCFHGLQAMRGIIDTLDETSQENLKQSRQTIEVYLARQGYSRQDIHRLWATISIYLHRQYLQEVSMGIVPAASLVGKDKAPSHEKVAPRLSAKLE
jgi:hypothetical protein